MRRISAHYIYPISSSPLKNGIVEIDDSGKILDIIDTKGELRESRNLEFYNGIITPGFINTHCHVELSELKGEFEQKKGFSEFLKNMVSFRRREKGASTKSMELFDSFMRKKGIVAVGDISNSALSKEIKKKSPIFYHTFVEAIGLGENYQEIFEITKKLFEEFKMENLRASIVPHAPYSVSKDLFNKIRSFAEKENTILTIHNQESESENQMFIDKSGELVSTFEELGVDLSKWNPSGKSSLESIVDYLPKNNNILFVHNTYSKQEEISLVNQKNKNAYWCLCPSSNLFIENRLPDQKIFTKPGIRVTLGTDSLASNTTLSILEEMKILKKHYNDINFEMLLSWATLNGAKALQIENKFGSIEKNKFPGLNLITDFDFEKMSISQKSDIKVLA